MIDPGRGIDLSIDVAPGRTLALLGPEGAGKSTVLRTVAGLYAPAGTRVVVGDTVLADVGNGHRAFWSPPRSRAVELLDGTPDLYAHLTVRGNVMFRQLAAGVPRRAARTFADHLLDAVGARDLARHRTDGLDAEQAQRVALAQALAASPRVLLLDEPFAALDAAAAAALRDVLRRVLEGVTAVVVTRDADDARALADDVVVLDGGRVVRHGPAHDVVPAAPTAGAGHHRRSVAEHAAAVAELVRPAIEAAASGGPETVHLGDLLVAARSGAGLPPRVLARDATAAVALPGFDNSQMDGYAVRSSDLAGATPEAPVTLPVAAAVPAGTQPAPLEPGTAAPVMTGAPVPPGADAVVRIEDADPPRFLPEVAPGTDHPDRRVRFSSPVDAGTYVRRTGSDVAAGDVVVVAGTPLGPPQLGALVAAGVTTVEAAPAPHVLLVSTGSELVAAGEPLGAAQVYDANGATLAAALAQVGARVSTRVVADRPEALRDVLAAAPDDVALVVSTGGVSAGAYEVVRQAFGDVVWFGHVAVQPGGPQGLGTLTLRPDADADAGARTARTVPLVAFPGNPVSAFVSFELFLRPVLGQAAGARPAHRPTGSAPLADPLDSPAAVHQVRRGVLDDDGRVRLVGGPGSHLLSHLAAATLLVHVPPGVARLERGDVVHYWEIR